MVAAAEDYRGSSAGSHCARREDAIVAVRSRFPMLAGIGDWSAWLAQGIADVDVDVLRRHASQNLPCGSPEFIAALECEAGRSLRYRPRGGRSKVTGTPKTSEDASLRKEASSGSHNLKVNVPFRKLKVNVPSVTS
jgi:hypothetical protein